MKRVLAPMAVIVVVALAIAQQRKSADVSAQTSSARPDLELRLIAGEFKDGLPRSFTFEVVNMSDHPVLIPAQPSSCFGINGTVRLAVTFTSPKGEVKGQGGGCGSNGRFPPILERLKSWKRLEGGERLSVAYSNSFKSEFGNTPGTYEFVGTYDPPELTPEDSATLERAGIAFPRRKLVSNHLRFDTADTTATHE